MSAATSQTKFVPTVPPIRPVDATPSGPIGLVKELMAFTRNPLETLTEDLVTERVVKKTMAGKRHVFVNDPKAIRQICLTNMDNYPLGYWREQMFKRMMPEGIISLNGERWKQARRLMNPVFSPRALVNFAALMETISERHAAELAAQVGTTVDMSTRLQSLALDILLDSLIASEAVIDRAKLVRESDELAKLAGLLDPVDALSAPDWVPRLHARKIAKITRSIGTSVRAVIDARRGRTGSADEHDFLALLMHAEDGRDARFSDAEIVDNLLTIVGAGHETTARSLGWTFYLLSQAPDILARLEAEVDAAPLDETSPEKWLSILPFTEAVVKESLRLYPPAPEISRQALSEDTIGDITIEAGSEVHVVSWLIHRHRALWDEPDAFDPDRWLGERAKGIDRFQFLPFSTGPRVCIGGAFAMLEMVIAVAALTRRLRFSFAGDEPPIPVVRITVRPSQNLRMAVAAREPAANVAAVA